MTVSLLYLLLTFSQRSTMKYRDGGKFYSEIYFFGLRRSLISGIRKKLKWSFDDHLSVCRYGRVSLASARTERILFIFDTDEFIHHKAIFIRR
jgi:hypothetical protein